MEFFEFSPAVWSLSRRLRREFCPRAAIMHYREAPAAAKMAAGEEMPPLLRKICSGRRMISDGKFIRELLLHTMQKEFYTGETDPGILGADLADAFDVEFEKIIFGRSSRTLATLNGSIDIESKRQELLRELKECVSALISGREWENLLHIPVESRRTLPKVLDLYINDLRCFATPLCAFNHRGKLWIVELRSGEFSGCENETALIHAFYALNYCGRNPDMVESFILDYRSGQMRHFGVNNDISAALRKISAEAGRWAQLAPLALVDIPGNKENCPRCVFAGVCREL